MLEAGFLLLIEEEAVIKIGLILRLLLSDDVNVGRVSRHFNGHIARLK